ncbi:Late embryogenesis abundant (LEA) protein-related [Striga hermonthica]|uniref:Late embryogenesis abundant (LEA) protein-related n=1 Tax=Striga hermonthica TaxID=68872 RepID=A0A9N7MHY9_STRHE|nr:Late embryogenesis abundant (LEA) protein-related [Striga hermonthica]
MKFQLLLLLVCASQIYADNVIPQVRTCTRLASPCFLRRISCPRQCPSTTPTDPKAKACYVDCNSPMCTAQCKHRKPSCNGAGAACYDPRFIGPDGGVFYFHGRKNEHFALVSDKNLQINARFIGHRPTGRARDYTWIQALGVRFGPHNFSVEATAAAEWDQGKDHLRFGLDGREVVLPLGHLSQWRSENGDITLQRITDTNSIVLSVNEIVEIGVNAVPITKEDDRVHKYHLPSDDCFSHLEVQFSFFGLSSQVEGVLGHTYRPDYEAPLRLGLVMAVVGGEDKYRTTSLFSADCKKCVFDQNGLAQGLKIVMDHGTTMDCSAKFSGGNGIVCKK